MTYIYCGTVDIAENEVEIFRNILDSLKINYDVEDEGDADFDHTGTTEHEEESSLSLQESSDFPSFSIKEEPKDEFSIEYTEHHESVMDIEDSKPQNDKTDFLNLLNFPEKIQPVPKVLRFQPSIDGKISMGRVVPNRKLQQFMTENAMLCPFCRKLFKTTKHRNEHVKYCFDNPNRIVSNCPICKKSVCDPYYLRKHLRNVHGQASDTPTATSSS